MYNTGTEIQNSKIFTIHIRYVVMTDASQEDRHLIVMKVKTVSQLVFNYLPSTQRI